MTSIGAWSALAMRPATCKAVGEYSEPSIPTIMRCLSFMEFRLPEFEGAGLGSKVSRLPHEP